MVVKKKKDKLIQISNYFSQEMLDWIDTKLIELGNISRNAYLTMLVAKDKKESDAQEKKAEQ